MVRIDAPDWGADQGSDLDTETINMYHSPCAPTADTHAIDIQTSFAGFLS